MFLLAWHVSTGLGWHQFTEYSLFIKLELNSFFWLKSGTFHLNHEHFRFLISPLQTKSCFVPWGCTYLPVQNSQPAFSLSVSLQSNLWCAWLVMSVCCLSSCPKGCGWAGVCLCTHLSVLPSVPPLPFFPPFSFYTCTHTHTHLSVCMCMW